MLGRFLAAISYIGLTGALTPLAQPDNPFVVRHARGALVIHLLRFALVAPVFALTLRGLDVETGGADVIVFATNFSMLLFVGVPVTAPPAGFIPWIGAVLAVTWLIDLFGIVIALAGLTADWQAFFHADWPNRPAELDREALTPSNATEKEQLTRLREGRLARVREADSVAAQERRRRETLTSLHEEFDTATARRAHLTQLFELGEISERRYGEQRAQLDARLAELGAQIAIRGARQLPAGGGESWRRELPTDIIVHAPLQTLAITARSGIPLLTYGHFRLDEALVTGILSAFNSLSEEVFGAQVHKTELAEGQVLSFVHARWTVTMAVFDEDPSPMQIRLLREFVDEFERRNGRELGRPAPDPTHLEEVEIPFTFTEAPNPS